MTTRPEYITVGHFGRPRGVFGEINVTPDTDFPDRYLELTELLVERNGQKEVLTIESATLIGGRPVVKLKGFDSREAVGELTNQSIEIPGDLAVELPDGKYYQFDLVGCRVIGIDGTDYGVLEEILFYPSNDLYRIKSDSFGEILLPVVDKFIKGVDIEKKEIIIDPPEGLIEKSS
ncbi:MAG: 16S rRNA processing protein RimM [candidate division Zixibacteria bacterium]|nr:16S rRNA processing protein RimM [candidate division Zixibacteria bacterium]